MTAGFLTIGPLVHNPQGNTSISSSPFMLSEYLNAV